MAGHVSQMMLIVRAQNQASGALRRVGKDLQGMGRMRALQIRQNEMIIRQQGLMRQRQRALNELQSIQTGSRARALEIRDLQNKINLHRRMSGSIGMTALQARKLALQTQHLTDRQRELGQRGNILKSELAEIAQRYNVLTAKQRALSGEVRKMRWEPISRAGSALQHMGRVGQYAFLVLGGSLAFAAHQAAMFEKQVTLAATQTARVGQDASAIARNTQKLMPQILAQMQQFPATAAEMSDSAYEIFSSLDVSLKDGMGLLKNFNKASVAGQVSLADATSGALTVLNDFRTKGMPIVKNSTKLLNTMFAGVQYGRITFAELSGSMSQLVPAFKAANQPFDEMVGLFAFLTRHMPAVGMARTALARLTEAFADKDFREGVKKSGVNIEDATGRMKPMTTIINDLVKAFPKLARAAKTQKGDLALQTFFKDMTAKGGGGLGKTGTIQMRRALQFMILYNKSMNKVVGQVKGTENAFDRSLKAMQQTTGVRWEVFVNQLRAIALMIGAAVIPEILKLAPHISNLVNMFRQLDPELRSNIVKWTAISVGILGLASAAAFLLGPLIRIFALLGKTRLLFFGISGVLVAVAAGIALLSGNWDGLNTIIDSFFGLTERGTWGWVLMLGLGTVGVLKLTKAFTGLRNAYIGAGAAGAASSGGLVGFLGRTKNFSANLKALPAAAAGATRIGTALNMAKLGVMALPGPLKIAAVAMAGIAGAAYLWQRRQKQVADELERTRLAQMKLVAVASRPTTQAADFGKLGSRMIEAKGLGIEYKRQQLILKGLREQFRGATGDQKKMLGLDIQDAIIRMNTYYDMWGTARAKVAATSPQLLNAIRSEATAQQRTLTTRQQLKDAEVNLAKANELYHRVGAQRSTVMQRNVINARKEVERLKTELTILTTRSRSTGDQLKRSFSNIVKDLQGAGQLQRNIPQGAIDAALRLAVSRGKTSVGDIKAVIKAFVDKGALARAKGDIQRAVRGVKVDIRINKLETRKSNLKEQINKAMHFGEAGEATALRVKLGGVNTALAAAKKARSNINATFRKTIIQRINVKVNPPNTAPLGRAISDGVANGILSGIPAVRAATDQLIAEMQRAATAKAEIRSPSRLFERTVGAPIVDGIIKGILNKEKIEKTAALVMNLFNGAFLQARDAKIEAIGDNRKFDPLKLAKYEQQALDARARFKKKHHQRDLILAKQYEQKAAQMRKRAMPLTAGDLLKDMQGQARAMTQFNNKLASLQKRGIPAQMLEDLRALGIDGLKYITALAGASPKELAKIVATWQRMQKEIKRSQRASVEGTKEFTASMKAQLKELTDTAAQKLLDTWNEFRSTNAGNFGELFGGMDAESFEEAHAQWQENMDDLMKQMKDLTDEALKARIAELQGAFGALFSGEWLTGAEMTTRADWGIPQTFDDLFKDLDMQLQRFNKWRQLLGSLANKVPTELAAQLESLGPEGIAQLEILNNATAEQLAAYIALWNSAQGSIGVAAAGSFQTTDYLAQLKIIKDQIAQLQEPMAITGQDVINNLDGQMTKWKEYEALLVTLKDRGVPLALIQQLRQMGPTALPYMVALNKLADDQLLNGKDSWVGKWKESQRLITASTNTMMSEQLTMWYSHGANIASAIIAGVASEQQALLDFFGKLFGNLLQGKFPTMAPKPPAPGGYFYSSDPDSGERRAGDYPVPAGNSYSTHTASNVHMTVNAHQDEELMSTMERAAFRLKNRSE